MFQKLGVIYLELLLSYCSISDLYKRSVQLGKKKHCKFWLLICIIGPYYRLRALYVSSFETLKRQNSSRNEETNVTLSKFFYGFVRRTSARHLLDICWAIRSGECTANLTCHCLLFRVHRPWIIAGIVGRRRAQRTNLSQKLPSYGDEQCWSVILQS